MPPAAQRVARTSPSADPHGASADHPAPSIAAAPSATAVLRVSAEKIELINELLSRLQFARDAGDPARMLSVLADLDAQTGILELVIQRVDETAPSGRTEDPLSHARAVARKARQHVSTARAQAEGMQAAQAGAVSRLGSAPAPTSIGETRRRAEALGEPGICDDATMLDHSSQACALTPAQRETTRVMATTSLNQIAHNWMSAIEEAQTRNRLAPLLEETGPAPALELLLDVGLSLVGLGVGSALVGVLNATKGGLTHAAEAVADKVGESLGEGVPAPGQHEHRPDLGMDPAFHSLADAASQWNKISAREVRKLADPQLVSLTEVVEAHHYSREHFSNALSALLAQYSAVNKIGTRTEFARDQAELVLVIAPDGTYRHAVVRMQLAQAADLEFQLQTGKLEFITWVDPALLPLALRRSSVPLILNTSDRRWAAPPPQPPGGDLLRSTSPAVAHTPVPGAYS